MPNEMLPKNQAKILLVLAHAAAEAVPRGGDVVIKPTGTGFLLEVTGKRTFLNDEFISALEGDYTDMKPKFTPAYIIGQLARQSNGLVSAMREDEQIVFKAEFAG